MLSARWAVTYHTVPVELTQSTLVQVLLRSRDIMTLRKVLYDLLTEPAAGEYASLGVGESPLQGRHEPAVRFLGAEVREVLLVIVHVPTTQNRPALSVAIARVAIRKVDGPLDKGRTRKGSDCGSQKEGLSKEAHDGRTSGGRSLNVG